MGIVLIHIISNITGGFMKSVYSTIALCLMAFALFCVVFALTLANYNEIRPLALVAFISIAMSLWFLHDGGEK